MNIEDAIATLEDESKTWVDRRDAVDALAKTITDAEQALQSQAETKDPDVRMAVARALEKLDRPTPAGKFGQDIESLDDVVYACAKPGEREVVADGDGFRVDVTLKSGRNQTVRVERHQRNDGIKVVRVYSPCGGAEPDAYDWCLKANLKLVQSSVGLIEGNGNRQFVLLRTFLDGEITKPEMHAAIKEIAHYADWLENKITGKDDL